MKLDATKLVAAAAVVAPARGLRKDLFREESDRVKALEDVAAMSAPVVADSVAAETTTVPTASAKSASSAKSPKSGKERAASCAIEALEGKFPFFVDFFIGHDNGNYIGDYAGAVPMVLEFERPQNNGTGVMKATFGCFDRPMVAVRTGFPKDGVIPFKMASYVDVVGAIVNANDLYEGFTIEGEYSCVTEELIIGGVLHFANDAFGLAEPTKKNNTIDLEDFCPFGEAARAGVSRRHPFQGRKST